MKTFKRISGLVKKSENRVKYAFFLVLGLTFFLGAILSPEPAKTLLIEFSVTFSAITILNILWEFLGGDPVEEQLAGHGSEISNQVSELENVITENFTRLNNQTKIANDIYMYDLGIERIWPSRREFRADAEMGIKWWKDIMLNSEEISILSISFWNDWMHDKNFRVGLKKSIVNGTIIKILIYEPGSSIQQLRAWAEEDKENEMTSEISRTVEAVKKIKSSLSAEINNNLEVRFTSEAHHMAQILRTENGMVIANYLHGLDGLSAPTIFVQGNKKLYYRVYSDQFERLWGHGKQI